MISSLVGKITEIREDSIEITVGGVGYEVSVTLTAIEKLHVGEDTHIYTYMSVREDGISLYGFLTIEEKKMFLKLISISGIGPKVAITILSSISPSQLAVSIIMGDIKTLAKVKGIGKKTAERIILELKESVEPVTDNVDNSDLKTVVFTTTMSEAVDALRYLGVNQAEATKAVNEAVKTAGNDLENIIKVALQLVK